METISLRSLEVTPRIQQVLNDYLLHRPGSTAEEISKVIDELKLRAYFAGFIVGYIDTPQGREVLTAGEAGSGEVRARLEQIDAQTLAQIVICVPESLYS
jgi:hypothetical protein